MEGMPSLNAKLEAGEMRAPSYAGLELDLNSRTCSFNGVKEKFSDQEYQVLWLLVRAQGNVLSRSEIDEFIHDGFDEEKDLSLDDSLVRQVIRRINKKLETLTEGKILIENKVGLGYYIADEAQAIMSDGKNT